MTCTQAERGAKANEYIGTFEVTMKNKTKALKFHLPSYKQATQDNLKPVFKSIV
jgi:hypothetical protein